MSLVNNTRTVIPEWTFADRLRKARATAGLDQREFAKELGVTSSTYSAYEAGRSAPRFRNAIGFASKVEEVTGVAAWWVLGSEPRPSD